LSDTRPQETSQASNPLSAKDRKSQAGKSTEVLEVIQAYSQFSGPLPPPSTLKGYEDILPGCADRIIAMAEAQQRHRFEIEGRVVAGNVSAQSRGQHYALIVVLAFALIGGALAYFGKSATGLTTMLAPIGGVAGLFIYGRRQQAQEREEKLQSLNRRHGETDRS
jgi:uncharacterized membrane protein